MIAPAKPIRQRDSAPTWHPRFLEMLPSIRKYARSAFGHLDIESRDDAIAEVVANATVAFARLVELQKVDLAYPSVLARYGIAQYRDGRRIGNHLRIGEVLSPYAQRRKRFVVESLDTFEKDAEEWTEAVVEDHHTPIPDQAAFRIDFPDWLTLQTKRNRQIAEALALGHSTGQVARRFKVSPGRISQLRRELYQSWQEFHHEATVAAV